MTSLWVRRLLTLGVGLAIWATPPPAGISTPAWQLFAIFIAAILSVVIDALPILVAAVVAVAAAALKGTLAPEAAYAGFSEGLPQGSSANVIFVGSGYVTQREAYRVGGIVTATNLVIWIGVGTPWILLLHG